MAISSNQGPADRAALVTNGIDTKEIPDLFTSENQADQLEAKLREYTKASYSADEVFGQFCHTSEYINCPVDMAFEYMSNIYALEEFTYSTRDFTYIGGGMYKGREALAPDTVLYLRIDAYPDSRVVDHVCAWDQGGELWMRYHFRFLDAMPTLGRPGTVVLWTNCKHPYYDRNITDVPSYISEPRDRTDRPWVGDIWPDFYAIHKIEAANLKRILEYRFANA